MKRFTASQAREDFSDLLNQVAYAKERIVFHRHGKDVAALVSIEDLTLLKELEDQKDIASAEEALTESNERIPYEQIRRELKLTS